MKSILERINQNLLFGVLLCVALYYGKIVLVPLILGALLAMLMAPICRSLDNRGIHRALSCTLCILILLVTFLGILFIIIAEINSFTEDISQLQQKGKAMLAEIQRFIEEKFNIAPEEQVSIAKEQVQSEKEKNGGLASRILSGLTTTVATLILMMVYTFLFLFSKEKYEMFFIKLYQEEDTEKVRNVVNKISEVSQKYLTGRVMSVIILAVLYTIALLIIGVKNAVLLALIAAILTIIPYVGSTIGGMFPFLMALVTENTFQPALMVAGSILLIQTIDNYFIEPNIVGGEVNLSALASILSIIVGGFVWGVAGMILFIPLVGILKIICDHVESLKPLAYVISDPDEKSSSRIKNWLKEKFKV